MPASSCFFKLANVLKHIRSLRWRQPHQCRISKHKGHVLWSLSMHFTDMANHHLFPSQSEGSFRIPLITALPAATSMGSELAVELRPSCHSGSNRTKMKHQKQQTGTNLSPFQGSERLPTSTAPYPSSKTHWHHRQSLEGIFKREDTAKNIDLGFNDGRRTRAHAEWCPVTIDDESGTKSTTAAGPGRTILESR